MTTQITDVLVELGRKLRHQNYQFVTITPLSHETVLQRNLASKSILRDLFGWNRWVSKKSIPNDILRLLQISEFFEEKGDQLKSLIRASTINEMVFIHSGFPTTQNDSVFFGPDTYRFFNFIKNQLQDQKFSSVFDVGCGSGAGGLALAEFCRKTARYQPKVILGDINHKALQFAKINAQINDVPHVTVIESHLLDQSPDEVDLVISNPPYIMDDTGRAYRHGGDHYGAELSIKIVEDFLRKKGGSDARLLFYTGVCIVDGVDVFLNQITPLLNKYPLKSFHYEELDPDVFGDQLLLKSYQDVDRIAAVGLDVQ